MHGSYATNQMMGCHEFMDVLRNQTKRGEHEGYIWQSIQRMHQSVECFIQFSRSLRKQNAV